MGWKPTKEGEVSDVAGGAVGELGINVGRSGVEIWWETGDYEGPVLIKAVNAENGDVGIAKDENDGKHFLTWPPGTYTDDITVYKDVSPDVEPDASDVIARGQITVNVSGPSLADAAEALPEGE